MSSEVIPLYTKTKPISSTFSLLILSSSNVKAGENKPALVLGILTIKELLERVFHRFSIIAVSLCLIWDHLFFPNIHLFQDPLMFL